MLKVILGLFFLSFIISASGCQTITRTAKGFGAGVKTIVVAPVCGFSKGIAEDASNTWKAIDTADKWLKENCW